jgi:hypothetical protein
MLLWNILSTLISVVALLGTYYTYQQFRYLRDERERDKKRVTEDDEWAEKFTEATQQLTSLAPKFFAGVPGPPGIGRPGGDGLGLVFPELELRQRFQQHLIQFNGPGTRPQARSSNPEQLRLTPVRETIQKVLDRIEEVSGLTRSSPPDLASKWMPDCTRVAICTDISDNTPSRFCFRKCDHARKHSSRTRTNTGSTLPSIRTCA